MDKSKLSLIQASSVHPGAKQSQVKGRVQPGEAVRFIVRLTGLKLNRIIDRPIKRLTNERKLQ